MKTITSAVERKGHFYKVSWIEVSGVGDLEMLFKKNPQAVLKAYRRGAPLVAANEAAQGTKSVDKAKLRELLDSGMDALEAIQQATTVVSPNEITEDEYKRLTKTAKDLKRSVRKG